MLVFFSKAFNIPALIPVVKHVLTESTVSETQSLASFVFAVKSCMWTKLKGPTVNFGTLLAS